MKNILGLDLGTNSIGWALVEKDDQFKDGKILGLGSRILPTDSELLSKFETGQAASKNANRRQFRGSRRLKFRYKLRRDRLIKAMKLLGWINEDFQPGHTLTVSISRLEQMKTAFGTSQISDDWVVYFLRHIGLEEKLEKSELARVVYHMNQRRGFKSNRKSDHPVETQNEGDDEEGRKKREKKIERVTVTDVIDTGDVVKGYQVFEIRLKDGRIGSTQRKIKPDWKDQTLELEVTTVPPTKKDPLERFEFRPLTNSDQDQWAKQKVARQADMDDSGLKYPGTYYFNQLRTESQKNSTYVIKDVTIDRSYFESELKAILTKQMELDTDLEKREAIDAIAMAFYPKNLEKQKELKANGLTHLLLRDIVYYQRPLKSKKSSISDCRFEYKNKIDPSTGKSYALKVAPASSPVFQEFRIWQTLSNIRIFQRTHHSASGKTELDKDVSDLFITKETMEALFDLFDRKEKVRQKEILQLLKLDIKTYVVNLYNLNEDKELPGNETKALIRKFFKKASQTDLGESVIADPNRLFDLWHLLYSVDDRKNIRQTLTRWYQIPEESADFLASIPAFKLAYATLSNKAMNKMLPLMRMGKHWSWTAIPASTRERLEKILDGEFDDNISEQVRQLFQKYQMEKQEHCQGLSTPMAAYAVYGVHSERTTSCYTSPDQVIPKDPLNLRNPVVEQVVNETLRLVRDVWKTHGRPFEIHIELARELKKNRKEREEMTKMMSDNEQENKRIAAILRELKLGNPNSLSDIEKLKLWERQAGEMARSSIQDVKFKRPSEPTASEIEKYKLWAQQQFISPYSGQPIPISRLFSRDYDIDHIIPRSRLFDDSLENKVVVESLLNNEKGKMTAMEYIKKGSAMGYVLLNSREYEEHVLKFFSRKKRILLLSEDVPDQFINRQLVDTRYIGRKITELLAPVSENQSDPIIVSNGTITHELKANWGLSEVMKELVKWRFERLEVKTGKKYAWYEQETDPEGNPTGRKVLRLKGYEKRIDHRHHALDALVVACTTRSHIKYLNDLNRLRENGNSQESDVKSLLPLLLLPAKDKYLQSRKFRMPWERFRQDANHALSSVIVSFRNRIRIMGKKANRNLRYELQSDGSYKKKIMWSVDINGSRKLSPYVRQSLHKATIWGQIQQKEYKDVNISEALGDISLIADKAHKKHLRTLLEQSAGDIKKAIKAYKNQPLIDRHGNELQKIAVIEFRSYATSRVAISSGFDLKRIDKIPDPTLQEMLREHLVEIEEENKDRPKESHIDAFGPEGTQILNRGRRFVVKKVTTIEDKGSKFPIRPGAFTEADKGTNLYFVIYESHSDPTDRQFSSIPLRDVIEAKAAGESFVEERQGYRWFLLSPNDLVYMPDEGEWLDRNYSNLDSSKVYKMVSCTGKQCFFIQHTISKVIVDKVELGSKNKEEKAIDGRMVKQFCHKLEIDRLGGWQTKNN
jgi:CRISPR-associated endonuclease Csn1